MKVTAALALLSFILYMEISVTFSKNLRIDSEETSFQYRKAYASNRPKPKVNTLPVYFFTIPNPVQEYLYNVKIIYSICPITSYSLQFHRNKTITLLEYSNNRYFDYELYYKKNRHSINYVFTLTPLFELESDDDSKFSVDVNIEKPCKRPRLPIEPSTTETIAIEKPKTINAGKNETEGSQTKMEEYTTTKPDMHVSELTPVNSMDNFDFDPTQYYNTPTGVFLGIIPQTRNSTFILPSFDHSDYMNTSHRKTH